MARAEEALIEEILELLAGEPQGLGVEEIVSRLLPGNGFISPRGIRNLLTKLEGDGRLVKSKRWGGRPGAPPYLYFHKDHAPHQLALFEESLGISVQSLKTKTELAQTELDHEERQRQETANSVLGRMAVGYIDEERYARAIINIAPALAEQDPVELVVAMARWVVENLNAMGDRIEKLRSRGELPEADKLAAELNLRLAWCRRYFQRLWRLDHGIGNDIQGIMELPGQARHFVSGGHHSGRRVARLDVDAARERLRERILGDKVISILELPSSSHKAAAGTDASVADLYLEHAQGSFIPPDPVVVMTAAAALKTRSEAGEFEYQDFDIYPDRLREYEDHTAAVKGLVISPLLRQILPEQDFKHTRMAAMELRQYWEDLRVSLREAEWRPIGGAPMLGIMPKPTLIFRDGRVFPLVHRLKDFEDDGLYGQIVRAQIEKFAQTVNQTFSGLGGGVVYAAAVKSPEMSWLAPLVFWYLHTEKVKVDGKVVVEQDDMVYRPLFPDTAVSHLLFLGLAKQSDTLSRNRLFITCRAVRRFSDIAVGEDAAMPPVLHDAGGHAYLLDENDLQRWEEFVEERIEDVEARHEVSALDITDYSSFTYLCSKLGVAMLYAAPSSAYGPLVHDDSGAHFLIPRLEVAVDMQRLRQGPEEVQKDLEGALSWLATGGYEIDAGHTQSAFDTGERATGLPVLVPDVILLAHQAVTFARTQLGQEVQDELRALISDLRRRLSKGR